jgi:hypothetical protein
MEKFALCSKRFPIRPAVFEIIKEDDSYVMLFHNWKRNGLIVVTLFVVGPPPNM